jgi:type IV fimbrial biogenesis protein FimT
MSNSHSNSRTCQRGFTLIETMVVIAMVAIVTSIAVPSWKQMIVRSEVRAAVNDFTGAIQMARVEAVRRRANVQVCPSTDGATCLSSTAYGTGWIILAADSNLILQDFLPLKRLTMTKSGANSSGITFLANGLPIGNFAGMHITVAEDTDAPDASLTRHICIARTGRTRVFTDDQWLNLSGSSACTS